MNKTAAAQTNAHEREDFASAGQTSGRGISRYETAYGNRGRAASPMREFLFPGRPTPPDLWRTSAWWIVNVLAAQLAFLWPVCLGPITTVAVMGSSTRLANGFLLATLFTVFCQMDGLYRPCSRVHSHIHSCSSLKATIWSVLFIELYLLLAGEWRAFVLLVVLVSASLHFILMAALHNLRSTLSRKSIQAKKAERRVVIVGIGHTALKLASQLLKETDQGVIFEGFVDDRFNRGSAYTRILGRITDLQRLVRSHFIDEVIVCLPDEPLAARRAIFVARRLRIGLKVVLEVYGCAPKGDGIEMAGDIPLLTLQEPEIHELRDLAKRGLDVAIAASTLLALAPALAVIALLVKLDSTGPALYCAPRVGRRGRQFRCYKFRTMRLDADRWKPALRDVNERTGPFFKLRDDPRITRIGACLRRYSLDELPQLWNVVLGDMSLVGPRPHPLDDHARYTPEHFQRLAVKPGLTGLWQVTARNDPSFERNMALDREYIERQSLKMDLWILLRTVREVAIGSGV